MRLEDISLPQVYLESSDFRFFTEWFEAALEKVQYDITNFMDLYDPLRCPESLLWMLGDTIGFTYDNRLPASFNRLVLLYFMSMIRLKGSRDGMTLAAQTNLAQHVIENDAKNNEMLYNRLENTSIPVNSVSVIPHANEGYIDVVYFSTKLPIDACIEYVRPLGMYVFQQAGVKMATRTKISVDARLADSRDINISIGPTHVGHYSREDYARMQKMYYDEEQDKEVVDTNHTRRPVWYRNSKAEGTPPVNDINPGWRALYSLQLCNNEHVVSALMDYPVFSLGLGPQPPEGVEVTLTNEDKANLLYDKNSELTLGDDVYTIDEGSTILSPKPAVNPIMSKLGDPLAD